MTTTKTALVTGANRGIGKEIARQLGRLEMTVLVAARDEERGKAAADDLVKEGIDARPVHLDVADPSSVEAVASLIEREHGRLDVLINNAGILADADGATPEVFERTFQTNVIGVHTVTTAMLPMLRTSPEASVVNLSSELGSLTVLAGPDSPPAARGLFAYNASKAALNVLTVMFAHQLREDGIRVNAVSPGYVATEMNGYQGVLTVEQGASVVVRMATAAGEGSTGEFHGQEGPVPW